jgi:nitrite reductase/ring-hydroxylating ferredoxin subunit
MAEFVKVASASAIPPGEILIVELGDKEIAVANVDGSFVAFQNACSHRGGPLGEGILTGEVVECPFHAGTFNVRTGEALSAPAEDPIETYAVQVDGDDVKIESP